MSIETLYPLKGKKCEILIETLLQDHEDNQFIINIINEELPKNLMDCGLVYVNNDTEGRDITIKISGLLVKVVELEKTEKAISWVGRIMGGPIFGSFMPKIKTKVEIFGKIYVGREELSDIYGKADLDGAVDIFRKNSRIAKKMALDSIRHAILNLSYRINEKLIEFYRS